MIKIRIKQKRNWFERHILGLPPYKHFWIESEEDIMIEKNGRGVGLTFAGEDFEKGFKRDEDCIYLEVCDCDCRRCSNPRYNRIIDGKLNFDKVKKDG